MTVTIIIPVYNVSTYIKRCLDSVMCQNFTSLECILVDDASPDDSMIQAQVILKNYTGAISFKIERHSVNKGLSAARNTGILASTGDYLYFLDGDDALLESCIERMVEKVIKFGNPDVVQGSTIITGDDEQKNKYLIHPNVPEFSKEQSWIRKNMLRRKKIPVTAWNKLIRRDFMVSNHLLYKEGIWHEDEHWTFFAASKVQSMAFCRTPTYQHFINEGSIMTTAGQRSIESWFVLLSDYTANQGYDSRFERKTILDVLFCQLVRILENEASMFETNLNRLQSVANLCRQASFKHARVSELVLLWCYRWPLTWMRIFRIKWVRSIYFRGIRWFV